ncbi:MAG: SIS domain-containing protein [Ruminococcaceae bacterium]|nr:SIS domain-containing protein [Oscillospiraceae bacterium]
MMNLYERYPELEVCRADIEKAADMIYETYQKKGKVLACGNGGSCADSDHIVGELMKGFLSERKMEKELLEKFQKQGFEDAEYMASHMQGALPAISLTAQTGILTAFCNDVAPDMMYAQMVYGYAAPNDLLIGLSTSGNSKNVVFAAKTAKALGIATIAMTGAKESKLSAICDVTIRVPETETYKIQELHLPVYHYLCAEVERRIFG